MPDEELTTIERDLLGALYLNKYSLSVEKINELLYDGATGTENALKQTVSRCRAKLDPDKAEIKKRGDIYILVRHTV